MTKWRQPEQYLKIMKVETTITIEADLLEQVTAKDFRSNSAVFENALLQYLPKLNHKSQKRKLTREKKSKSLIESGWNSAMRS